MSAFVMGKNADVERMYSDFAPYPGQFIRLLSERNKIIKRFYTSLAKARVFNPQKGYAFAQSIFQNFCPSPSSSIRLLDAGCGTGEKTVRFACAFPNAEVIGIDFSEGSLSYAQRLKEYLDVTNVKFARKNLFSDPLTDLGPFDYIHCAGVIHHTEDPLVPLKNIVTVMNEKSYLWLLLYADYAHRHLENTRRIGLHMLFPDNNMISKRVEFLKDIGMARYTGSNEERPIKKILRAKRRLIYNVKDLWFSEYTRETQSSDTDLYDAYANPIVWYYKTEMVEELLEGADLDLLHYVCSPRNTKYEEKLKPYLAHRDIYEAMKISECFHYPNSFWLIVKKQIGGRGA
jgi:SAM-dependent methyltransferase